MILLHKYKVKYADLGLDDNKLARFVALNENIPISKLVAPNIVSISDFTTKRISTQVKCIDTVTGGGLLRGSSYELSGMYGVGKTQVAIQMMKALARIGMDVLYIYTEGEPPVSRIKQVINENIDKVKVAKSYGFDDLIALLKSVESVKMDAIVVDSITAVMRSMYRSTSDMYRYKKSERILLNVFKTYMATNGIVIYTNQIYSGPGSGEREHGGHLLYHFSNYRIRVRKEGEYRVLEAHDAPDVPNVECMVKITDSGVEDV